jgi:RNA polymerase sigma factor (sigma-70 family)
MMTTQSMSATANSDVQLVEWSLTGDRDAFRKIVERYQSLVCSITYNATGSLTLSEDLAQETFVAAWKQLSELREPAQLRAWLCGITRFLVGKQLRRQGHEPIHAAETVDAIHELPAPDPSPAAQAVSHEEEAILWRALERIPDTYREPLILFYREQQSVGRVAAELELSEDVVKQRLARGRKLLHEEVIAFVEGTLSRTAPGQAFSGAVLAALPLTMASVATATAGAAAKGSTAAKLGFWSAWLAPIIGIVGGMAAHWLVVRASPTEAERRVKKIAFIGLWVFVLVWGVIGQIALEVLDQRLKWSDEAYFPIMAGYWWLYAVIAVTITVAMMRRLMAIRRQSERAGERPRSSATPLKPATNAVVWAGTNLAFFSWLICVSWKLHDRMTAGIIAGLMVGLTLWNIVNVRGKIGEAAMRAVAGHLALAWGVVLVILNLRLDVWIAHAHRSSLAEIHSLLPAWVIPLLTLALVLWAGVVMALTKPVRRG